MARNSESHRAPDDPLKRLNEPFDEMFTAEIEGWVSKLPRHRSNPDTLPSPQHPDPSNELVGLCLSGGGMRAATFSLGVTQALAEYGLMREVDYLSTVSGGGYLGSSLSSMCAEQLPYPSSDGSVDESRLDMTKERFPYSFPGPLSTNVTVGSSDSGTLVHGLESPATRHVREHSKLILPSPGILDLETWIVASRYFVSTALLWALFLLPQLTAFFLVTMLIPITVWNRDLPFTDGTVLEDNRWILAIPLLFAFIVVLLSFPPGRDRRRGDRLNFSIIRWLQKLSLVFMGVTGAAVGFILAFWGYVYMLDGIAQWIQSVITLAMVGTGVVSFATLRQLTNIPEGIRRRALNLVFNLSGYLVIGIGLVAWYHFLWHGWHIIGWEGFSGGFNHYDVFWYPIAAIAVVTWIKGEWILNFLSLNRIYEQRLQRTWIIGATPGKGREDAEILHAEDGWTSTWVRPDIKVAGLLPRDNSRPAAPYHLICTALNIPGSTGPQMLNRKADSFVIAPAYSGSALTRWSPTAKLSGFNKMSLTQAAEISAAAVSPNMGMKTNMTLSVLMTLFNARLGRWVPNPRPTSWLRRWIFVPPPFLYWKEMLGMASHKDAFVYLSDGGHFENLGIYELLRRRCKYIIAVDATGESGDGGDQLKFGGLGIPLRMARIDFGVLVDMDLRPLMRDPETGFVKSYFAVGRIRYPKPGGHGSGKPGEPDSGLLIFIKSGMLDGPTPADIINYIRETNPKFPHDPTSDQQFDAPQFESYRELGFLAGMAVGKSSGCDKYSVAKRFKALDKHYQDLLNPKQPDEKVNEPQNSQAQT